MNKRIKALLLNERNTFVNGVTESDNKIYIHGSEENLEKLANLIVQECVNIVEGISPGYEDYRNQIEDAFRRDAISEMKSLLSGEEKCWCHTCRPIDPKDPESVYMRLCPNCGNKRCPKATDHNNECTDSNDAGQEGSIYYIREWI